MDSTLSLERPGSTPNNDPAISRHVVCLPAADSEFRSAVGAAIATLSDSAGVRELEELLRACYPDARVAIRDGLAGFGADVLWYAVRDGQPMRSQRRILIIDDDPAIADIIAESLELRFEVRSARDGSEALELLAGWTPNLILLDLSMPSMGGEEFAERYRRLPPPKAPLVVVSGAVDAAGRAEQMDARSVVTKPFDLEALAQLVDRYA